LVSQRILVVEDDTEQRAELVRILARAGYTVVHAADAADALRKVLYQAPELVVLDLRLPDASGVELAGAIRAVAGTTRMPLVVVTAYRDAAEELDPKRFGAECVLTKPVSAEQLQGAVERCLRRDATDTDVQD
jgi:DNA-binding response OmpR family regulator